MGDLLSPSRRDVVDRLRRRVDIYRRHNHGCLQRYDPSFQSLSEQSQRETILLYRRLLASKNRSPKSKNNSKDLSGGSSEQRTSNVLTSKLKSKKENRAVSEAASSLPNADPEVLQSILENLDKEDFKGLDDFEEVYLDKENRDDTLNMFGPLTTSSPSLPPKGPPFVDTPPPGSNPLNSLYDTNQNMGGVRTPTPIQTFRGSHQPHVLSDTGPAAETLKQMAAQHQNQTYAMKSPSLGPFGDPGSDIDQFGRGNGYAGFGQAPPGMPGQNSYAYGQQPPPHLNQLRGQPVPPGYPQPMPGKTDMSLPFGATKPLSHYPDPMGVQHGIGNLQQIDLSCKKPYSEH
ncbi:alpha1-likeprotein kinase 1-like [Octopus vulgaris]|uniref:Alpha1-likeprotein kinase 1-like n=1 Tax=Octopus vulgaris TaxID=6645 RepID=A0AA36BCB9_OCTVU|nr:alpha1-likeprotein kinase 1-like [Octopus vulgaris]